MAAPAAPASPRPSASAAHDLKTLVLSRHPAIVVESPEEERIDALVRAVAADLRLPLYEWTVTRGLLPVGGTTVATAGIYGSEDPLKGLADIARISFDALFLLKDLGPHVATPLASRRLRELATHFAAPGRLSTLLLTGARVELPPELEAAMVRFEAPRAGARGVPASDRGGRRAAGDQRPRAGKPRAGRVRRAGGRRVGPHPQPGRPGRGPRGARGRPPRRQRPGRGRRAQGSPPRRGRAARALPPADNPSELGGFRRLKAWLERARVGYGAEARAIGLEPPRGLLLVGVQGCGKSLSAKFIAREWRLPLLKLDAGRLYDEYVGESERISVAPPGSPSRWPRACCGSTRSRRASRRRAATPTRGSPVACSAPS